MSDADRQGTLLTAHDCADAALRHRVLVRCDLKCERCGAEHQRRVWQQLYQPGAWWAVVPGVPPHRRDLGVCEVRLLVVPTIEPWDGTEGQLEAICVGCWLRREVAAAVARHRASQPPRARQARLV